MMTDGRNIAFAA